MDNNKHGNPSNNRGEHVEYTQGYYNGSYPSNSQYSLDGYSGYPNDQEENNLQNDMENMFGHPPGILQEPRSAPPGLQSSKINKNSNYDNNQGYFPPNNVQSNAFVHQPSYNNYAKFNHSNNTSDVNQNSSHSYEAFYQNHEPRIEIGNTKGNAPGDTRITQDYLNLKDMDNNHTEQQNTGNSFSGFGFGKGYSMQAF
jgi:hypothetical protein